MGIFGGGRRPRHVDIIEECRVPRGEKLSRIVACYLEIAERGEEGVSISAERLRICGMILGMVSK
jgi:hypothetical protein